MVFSLFLGTPSGDVICPTTPTIVLVLAVVPAWRRYDCEDENDSTAQNLENCLTQWWTSPAESGSNTMRACVDPYPSQDLWVSSTLTDSERDEVLAKQVLILVIFCWLTEKNFESSGTSCAILA